MGELARLGELARRHNHPLTMGELARYAYKAFNDFDETGPPAFEQLPLTEQRKWMKVVAVISAIFTPHLSIPDLNAEARAEYLKRIQLPSNARNTSPKLKRSNAGKST